MGTEMKHQLYVLQQLLLNNYKERMLTAIDPQDQNAAKVISDLRSLAFEESRDVSTSFINFFWWKYYIRKFFHMSEYSQELVGL